MKSTHLSEMAGDIVDVTGELEIDTELRDLQTFQATPAVNNFIPDEEQNVTWYFSRLPSRRHVTLRVEKGGINDGNLGDSPFPVSWMAMGK